MPVNLSALGGAGQQFFDNNGNVLTGGKLWSYQAGTTTPQATYTSVTGLTAHTNPIILDSAGRVATGEIWVTAGQNYKFVLMTSANVTLATWDNITGINGTGIPSNATNVEYDPPFTGALTSGYSVANKLAQTLSVKDFGAVGDGVTNDTAAIQAAVTAAGVGGNVYFPLGEYLITSTIQLLNGQLIEGASSGNYTAIGSTLKLGSGAFAALTVAPANYMGGIRNIRVIGSSPFTVGSIGINFGNVGTAAGNMYLIENVYLVRLEIGIKTADSGSSPTQLQQSNVNVLNANMPEVGYGIWMGTNNADGWSINNTNASFQYAFFYAKRTGYTVLNNCVGYGYAAGAAFLSIPFNGVINPITLNNCQCEDTDFFIFKIVGDTQIISCNDCIINTAIEFQNNGRLSLNRCIITTSVKFNTVTAGNSILYDIANTWDNATYPLAVPTFNSNSGCAYQLGSYFTGEGLITAYKGAINSVAVNYMNSPTYGASIAIEPNKGDFQNIVVTDGVAFTVATPTFKGAAWPNIAVGAKVTIRFKNVSGTAMGVVTWGGGYRLGGAVTNPANAFSRSITFVYDGTNWIETSRSAADVQN
jgi:hypothetical protein